MLTVDLRGGLGNQLFQLAAGETIAKQTNRAFYVNSLQSPTTVHSTNPYFYTILREWKDMFFDVREDIVLQESSYAFRRWSLPSDQNVKLEGYFQNVQYVSSSFVDRLYLPIQTFDRDGVFLHIRGGDYVNHPFHDVGLAERYYPWAIRQFPKDTHFYVFTNDTPYAKTMPFLKDISYSFVETDELQSLNCMRQCAGGICANSTFSWWGAYLNPNRKLILPSKWFNDERMFIDGYFFPGCTIGQV